jgi:hypothetical protein
VITLEIITGDNNVAKFPGLQKQNSRDNIIENEQMNHFLGSENTARTTVEPKNGLATLKQDASRHAQESKSSLINPVSTVAEAESIKNGENLNASSLLSDMYELAEKRTVTKKGQNVPNQNSQNCANMNIDFYENDLQNASQTSENLQENNPHAIGASNSDKQVTDRTERNDESRKWDFLEEIETGEQMFMFQPEVKNSSALDNGPFLPPISGPKK